MLSVLLIATQLSFNTLVLPDGGRVQCETDQECENLNVYYAAKQNPQLGVDCIIFEDFSLRCSVGN